MTVVDGVLLASEPSRSTSLVPRDRTMNTSSIFPIASLALAASIAAQQTWIVDAQNRPGTNFTDIQPAVNVAAPGDVIRVRNATQAYGPVTIGRGIALLGDVPAPMVFSIAISGVPAI